VASRNFSRILDAVEGGRRFVVERRGHYICELGPPRPPARRLSESIAVIRGRAPVLLDDGFADDLAAVISNEPLEQDVSWDS
jgi:hypothetical protein